MTILPGTTPVNIAAPDSRPCALEGLASGPIACCRPVLQEDHQYRSYLRRSYAQRTGTDQGRWLFRPRDVRLPSQARGKGKAPQGGGDRGHGRARGDRERAPPRPAHVGGQDGVRRRLRAGRAASRTCPPSPKGTSRPAAPARAASAGGKRCGEPGSGGPETAGKARIRAWTETWMLAAYPPCITFIRGALLTPGCQLPGYRDVDRSDSRNYRHGLPQAFHPEVP